MNTIDIDIKKLQFTYISIDDLVLSLDRLTRFKDPESRYYRVFSDIICKHLLSPKLSKNRLETLDYTVVGEIVKRIWNESVAHNCNCKSDYTSKNRAVNSVLKSEILQTYNISDDVKKLIDVELDIVPLFKQIKNLENLPINLKRLLYIDEKYDAKQVRISHSLRFPVEKIVLCEGITEEILLPCFSKLYGCDFDKMGIKLISAGGKNQVAKMYVKFKEELKIPVFILLDADAIEISDIIKPNLRDIDRMYLIKHGEFEDIFSLNLIKRTINKRFKNICECTISDFHSFAPMTKTLCEFYRIHELGDFQKADFAKDVSENLKYQTDLTDELIEIIESIKLL